MSQSIEANANPAVVTMPATERPSIGKPSDPGTNTPEIVRQGRLRSSLTTSDIARKQSLTTVKLTREGVHFAFLAFFVVTGAVMRDVNLLVLLAGVLFGILFLQWRICRRTLSLVRAERVLPRTAFARAAIPIEFRFFNDRYWLSAWRVMSLSLIDYLKAGRSEMRAEIRRVCQFLPANSMRRVKMDIFCARRGWYELHPIEITTTFPFALLESHKRVWRSERLLVFPAIGKLRTSWRELFSVRPQGSRSQFIRSGSTEGEFFGLREYRSTDSTRLIHWRSSGRRNQLLVKQFEKQQSHQLCVLLDLVRDASSADLSELQWQEKVDQAIEFTATLATKLAGRDQLTLSIGTTQSVPLIARNLKLQTQVNELLTSLATMEAYESANPQQAAAELQRELHINPQLLVISTRGYSWTTGVSNSRLATDVVLSRVRVRWLNVTKGEADNYFLRRGDAEFSDHGEGHSNESESVSEANINPGDASVSASPSEAISAASNGVQRTNSAAVTGGSLR